SFRYPYDVVPDENSSFFCTIFRMFDTAFPFQYRPASVIICCQFAEDGFKINLSVSQRTKPARTVYPVLITAIYTLFSGGIEFCVFNMEHADAFMIVINISQVIQLLQYKMGRII